MRTYGEPRVVTGTELNSTTALDWPSYLICAQVVPRHIVEAAKEQAAQGGADLADILRNVRGVSSHSITDALANQYGVQNVDLHAHPPERSLLAKWGSTRALDYNIIPWRRCGGCTILLTPRPDHFERLRPMLEEQFGPVRMAITSSEALNTTIRSHFANDLVKRAETRLPERLSCRTFSAFHTALYGFCIIAALITVFVAVPTAAFATLTAIAAISLVLQTLLKLCCIVIATRDPPEHTDPDASKSAVIAMRRPTISVLVPLFRETAITEHLLKRLNQIDYPCENLDICLVLEASDTTTQDALRATCLPPHIRAIAVPKGTLQTKPRALNYALDFAHGSIIGIYDAEDAPAPDQLRKVADRFANCDQKVACLQGVLDYYNPRSTWLTRCFTLEYASWFRIMLPGIKRLGWVIPLGGTTLFLRRNVIEEVGGWDAHNVTEDADLGVRLARFGYITEIINTTTLEEANGRAWPWIKQRSRWIKGYAATYAVHMRQPLQLYRDLGLWRFFGFQIQFLGTLLTLLLTPLLLSFWLMPFGLPHLMTGYMPSAVIWTLAGCFAASELTGLVCAGMAVKRAGKGWLIPWAPTLHFYFPLATIAAYRGFLELAWKPFYWDKTAHGVLPARAKDQFFYDARTSLNPQPLPQRHPVSDASRRL